MAVIGRLLAGFAGKLWAVVGPPLIAWIGEKVIGGLREYIARKKAEKAIRDKARADRELTDKAETEEERDHAAENNRRW